MRRKKYLIFLAYPSCHVFQSIIIVSSYQKGKIASRSGIFIVNFEQVNASWEAFFSKQDSVNTGIKLKEHQTLLCLMFNLSLAFNTKASPFTQPAFTCSNRQWKHQSKIRSKVSVKIPKRHQSRLAGVFIINVWRNCNHCSGISIVDFEQVNAAWVSSLIRVAYILWFT